MNGDYLSALALLKTAYDEHGATYLDYVTPFVGDTIRAAGTSRIDSGGIGEALVERYGLEIPVGVLNTITRRLTRQGFGSRSHGHFIPDRAKLTESYNFDERRADSRDAIDALAASFIEFTEVRTGRSLSNHEAIAALIKYADNNGLPILKTMHGPTTLPTSLSLNEMEYVTSQFVIHTFEGTLPEMETLVMLAKGSKLASVLYLPDPQDVTRRISNLRAFFDTPTLLSALGHQGTDQERAARELLDLAYQSGVDVATFDHTVREMELILSTVAGHVHRTGYSELQPRGVQAHFLSLGYTASDIEILVGRLESDLRSLRVRIVEKPDIGTELSVNETDLEAQLSEEVNYPRRPPMVHDLDALTATFRQRRGQLPAKFEQSRAIFVTPNRALARCSKRFFEKEYGDHWPLAITDDDFATLLWLKQPLTAPDLPNHRVVADAYAALEPGLVSWESFLAEIEKLHDDDSLSHDDYYFLRYSKASKDALMQETLGKPVRVDARTVHEIIARAKNSIRAPIQDEVDQRTAELSKALAAAVEREDSLMNTVVAAEHARDRAVAKVIRAQRERDYVLDNQRKKARRRATHRAALLRRFLLAVVVVVLLVGIWFSIAPEWGLPPERMSPVMRWIAIMSVGGVLLLPITASVLNWDVTRFIRKHEVQIAHWLEKKYLETAGIGIKEDVST
ncbi:hypothetical protein [Candidatus Spongiisocius sp.]|uniref:hypothetical protein n=1 Tax=Candidatus Spongiisocius sp. TaxID=3101273 RepID=UPI003B5C8802